MSMFPSVRRPACAIQVGSRSLRAVVGKPDGQADWSGEVEVPGGEFRPTLQPEKLRTDRLQEGMRELAARLPAKVGPVSLVIPDTSVKVQVVPIAGDYDPRGGAKEELVRWSIGDHLPFPIEEAVLDSTTYGTGERRYLLVVAAHRDVLGEYEAAVRDFGTVVRTLPATLASGWLVEEDAGYQVVVYADADVLGCFLSRGEDLIFYRARRFSRPDTAVAIVMETLEYGADRLDIESGKASVMGAATDIDELPQALSRRGWRLGPPRAEPPIAEVGFEALAGALLASGGGR